MRLHNIWYLFKQGVKNIFQNALMSFSCIGVLVACMLLIGSSVMFTMTVNNLVGDVEKNNEIVVYLNEGVSEHAANQDLMKVNNISEVRYISKEEGLDKLSDNMSGGKDLMKGLEGEDNPLPNSFQIRIENADLMEDTIKEIEKVNGVLEVKASLEVANILSGLKRTVYYSGIGIVVILILVSLAIITNTIKITIFSRRREINIMKYVGATDTFIRLPFLVEGVLIGLISAFLSFLLLGIGYPYILNWASTTYGANLSFIFNNAARFEDVALLLLGGFSAIGVFIGVLSSTLFVRKHLRV